MSKHDLVAQLLKSDPSGFNIRLLREKIETKGIETLFWNIFDPYVQVVGTEVWDQAISLLPETIQPIIQKYGVDANLDWDFWGQPSFFGLHFETLIDKEAAQILDEFYDEDSDAYIQFLNTIEEEMWKIVKTDFEFDDFVEAKRTAFID